jgi:hypothetical protein
MRQSIMAEGCGRTELLTSWQPGNREYRKGTGQDMSFKDLLPLSYFLQPGPTWLHHLLVFHSNFESINGLIH